MQQPLTELLTPETRNLLEHARAVFAGHGVPAYVVGGALRDALLGVPIADPDLAVDGDAIDLSRAVASAAGGVAVPLDTQHGVARVVVQHEGGRQTHVDIARQQGGSLEADLRRRDFTVNAIALPLEAIASPDWATALIDPLAGTGDVERRRLRLVSSTALADDPARLLRAVRIAEHRELAMDEDLDAALKDSARLLYRVAPDRLRDELLLLLESPDPTHALHELDRLGLLRELIPEMAPMRGCEQPREHYWDVLEHTLQATGFAHRLLTRRGLPPHLLDEVPWDETLGRRFAEPFAHGHARATYVKLAALLHDIAKPETKSLEPNGRIRFFGHSERGALAAEAIMGRLHFSGKAARHVSLMVEEHLRPTQMAPKQQFPSRRAIWRFHRDLGDAAIDTLFLSLADYLAARGPDLEFQPWQHHARMCSSVLRSTSPHGESKKPRLVTGHDLIERLGVKPGPDLGRLLEALDEAAGAGDITTRDEALQLARKLITQSNHPPDHARKT